MWGYGAICDIPSNRPESGVCHFEGCQGLSDYGRFYNLFSGSRNKLSFSALYLQSKQETDQNFPLSISVIAHPTSKFTWGVLVFLRKLLTDSVRLPENR